LVSLWLDILSNLILGFLTNPGAPTFAHGLLEWLVDEGCSL
jgi:hypothetical protein